MIADLPPLLATIDGFDYEQRGGVVWRVAHDSGREMRVCKLSRWSATQAHLDAESRARAARIRAIRFPTVDTPPEPPPPPPPTPPRNNGRKLRTPATPEIIERLRSAPAWQCAACGCHDGRQRSLKDNRYCKGCARRRPIAGAQPE